MLQQRFNNESVFFLCFKTKIYFILVLKIYLKYIFTSLILTFLFLTDCSQSEYPHAAFQPSAAWH